MEAALTGDFLAHRLRAAGHEGAPIFSPAAARLIAEASQGIVRRINILADKALLAAFAADADVVEVRHARQAIAESPFGPRRGLQTRRPWRGVALTCLLLLLIGGIYWSILAATSNL
jgi:hypothetical protein